MTRIKTPEEMDALYAEIREQMERIGAHEHAYRALTSIAQGDVLWVQDNAWGFTPDVRIQQWAREALEGNTAS